MDGTPRMRRVDDLTNPTSNGVYQRIGYRRLLDAVELVFTSSS